MNRFAPLLLALSAACATAPARIAEAPREAKAAPARPPPADMQAAVDSKAAEKKTPPGKPPLEPGEVLLGRGGELALEGRPAATVGGEGENLVAWASTEVPGNSRLQAALAMVDAIVRAELLKAVQVGVASVETVDASSGAGGDKLAASSAASEVAKGLLPNLPIPQHAWLKVRRDNAEILRLYARLEVNRAAVTTAVQQALSKRPDSADLAERAMQRVAGAK